MADGATSTSRAVDPGAQVVRGLSAAGTALLKAWRRLSAVWQRSIQLRVITATLALSLAVVSLLGVTLMRQVTDGLLQQQVDAALAQASAGINNAQAQLDGATEVNRPFLGQMVRDLTDRGGPEGPGVVLMRPGAGSQTTRDITAASIPDELRARVDAQPSIFWTYALISYRESDVQEPGLAVGGQVRVLATDQQYGLYYFFPLTEQEQTLGVVGTALATAGLLLVLLLAAIAWLVTRQVVTPVRMAARIAARFSAGRLSERMAVRGRDDIARLATSFNQMAGSLQQQIGKLEELSRVQRQFASDVSHELRTPLTTVRMAADVLHESREDFAPVVRRSAELLQAQLDRFESLLGDLLEISRFDAGVATLSTDTVDVREIVYQVTDSAAPLAARKGSEVRVDAPDERCVAEVDARRVERVLRNLVVNAIEHGEGREVVVRVGLNDQAVAVAVRDYGVGLKPGESSLVFHRFWRADPARARTTGGTGLGLAIALEDARLHGGWLQAWGEPGAGSQFRLTLPRTTEGELTTSPISLMPEDASYDNRLSGVGSPYRRLPGRADAATAAVSSAASSDAATLEVPSG